MIKAIIVDDEKSGRETLAYIVENHFSGDLIIAGMASNVNEGVDLIANLRPDLVFLDMEMPNENGLSIVNKVKERDFFIIVTTAHKEYGIDAIKAGVLDYLLKPIDVDELESTIRKVKVKMEEQQGGNALRTIMNKVEGLEAKKAKVPLLINNNKTIFVHAALILRCEAEGNYTRIYFTDSKSELVTKLIKDVELLLADFDFFRPHKSHLINIQHVKSFIRSEDNIIMSDNFAVPLSRNSKADFLKKMNL